jgi:hypothetical protein
MPGPSWFIRQGVKDALMARGADPETAKAGGYVASTLSSLFFQDHYTHIIPDADDISNAVVSFSDATDIDVSDSLESVADTDNYAQNVHEDVLTSQQHFGSYDMTDSSNTTDSSDTSSTWSSSGSYLSSSNTIDPNAQYELPDGSYVYGSELKEGAGGNVYNSSSYGQSSSSDSISKSDIKKVS